MLFDLIEIQRGDPRENEPGRRIVLPQEPGQLHVEEVDLGQVRRSYLRHLREEHPGVALAPVDLEFLAAETRLEAEDVARLWRESAP